MAAESEIQLFTWWDEPRPDYVLWMRINLENMDLFLQGFISICNAFSVDFRRYVHGLPFKVRNDQKEYYEIQGYPI